MRTLFSIMLFSQTRIPNDVLKPYIHFLQNNKFHTAKDYFLERFKKYDIVTLSKDITPIFLNIN